jgi:hypothetical protein
VVVVGTPACASARMRGRAGGAATGRPPPSATRECRRAGAPRAAGAPHSATRSSPTGGRPPPAGPESPLWCRGNQCRWPIGPRSRAATWREAASRARSLR